MYSNTSISEEVERQHVQVYPDGCPNLCEGCVRRLQLTDIQVARWNRDRIARLFGHQTSGIGQVVARG